VVAPQNGCGRGGGGAGYADPAGAADGRDDYAGWGSEALCDLAVHVALVEALGWLGRQLIACAARRDAYTEGARVACILAESSWQIPCQQIPWC
jgi:hypothetical protein